MLRKTLAIFSVVGLVSSGGALVRVRKSVWKETRGAIRSSLRIGHTAAALAEAPVVHEEDRAEAALWRIPNRDGCLEVRDHPQHCGLIGSEATRFFASQAPIRPLRFG